MQSFLLSMKLSPDVALLQLLLSINDHSSLPLGENIVWMTFCWKIKKKKERNNPKKCFHELTSQIAHIQTKMKGMWCPTQWKLEENCNNYITKNVFQLKIKKSLYNDKGINYTTVVNIHAFNIKYILKKWNSYEVIWKEHWPPDVPY